MAERAAQIPLFGPSLDVVPRLKRVMAAALRESRLSREQVVDAMNRTLEAEGLGLRVTINSLEKWVAPSQGHVIPLPALPVFCRVLDTSEPLSVLAAPLGAFVAGERERQLMLLGEAQVEAKQVARKRRNALEALEDLA
ncbi:MAG: hypothetical protein KQJ78_11245 [Deltaproteobacteria bacterium]|nr:hypothetical protein [Deltaproteobacteria bacterium]